MFNAYIKGVVYIYQLNGCAIYDRLVYLSYMILDESWMLLNGKPITGKISLQREKYMEKLMNALNTIW